MAMYVHDLHCCGPNLVQQTFIIRSCRNFVHQLAERQERERQKERASDGWMDVSPSFCSIQCQSNVNIYIVYNCVSCFLLVIVAESQKPLKQNTISTRLNQKTTHVSYFFFYKKTTYFICQARFRKRCFLFPYGLNEICRAYFAVDSERATNICQEEVMRQLGLSVENNVLKQNISPCNITSIFRDT